MKSKVFCLGLSRTGTSSLTVALRKLGWKAKHYPKVMKIMKEAENHDALTDISVILAYREFDRKYQDAKFIMLVRNMNSWLRSCKTHWAKKGERGDMASLVRRAIFGQVDFDADQFQYTYVRHLQEVKHHFKGRKGKLLIMDIIDGDGYEKLCPFLSVPVLDEPFPHAQGGNDRKYLEE